MSCLSRSAWSGLMTQPFCKSLAEMKGEMLWRVVCRGRIKNKSYGRWKGAAEEEHGHQSCLECKWAPFSGVYLPFVLLCISSAVVCVWCNRWINNSVAVSDLSAAAPLSTWITPWDTLKRAGEQRWEREKIQKGIRRGYQGLSWTECQEVHVLFVLHRKWWSILLHHLSCRTEIAISADYQSWRG